MLFSLRKISWVHSLSFALVVLVASLLFGSIAHAAGETFSFDSNKEDIRGSGGVFDAAKAPNQFKQIPDPSSVGGPVPSGYDRVYGNNYDGTNPGKYTYPCQIYIAVNSSTGKVKVLSPGGFGIVSQCANTDAQNAVFGGNGIPTDSSIATNTTATEEVATGVDAVYEILGPALIDIRVGYYKSLGTSDTPSEAEWKQMVYSCWTTAQAEIVAAERAGGDTPIPDKNLSTKQAFARCLSKTTGISEFMILEKMGSIVADDVNKANADALGEETIATSTCLVDGIGWIVCSVAQFLGGVVDGIYGAIEGMFKVSPLNVNTADSGNSIYRIWSIFRNLANPVFVILFLIMIFSQLTGAGISNYGIKKTLPRLIVVAILMNVSFWITAIAIDVSNILGSGIYDLLASIRGGVAVSISENWGNIIGAILSGATLTAAAGTGAVIVGAAAVSAGPAIVLPLLAIALPLLLGALLAVITAIFALIARQVIITILVFVSPLAFAALLLPNTEKLFTKWRQMFVSLLIMYPVISIIFGGAQIAGLAVLSTAGSGDFMEVGIKILTGQAMMVIPLFLLIPLLLKYSGAGIDKLAGNLQSKINGATRPISGAARKFGAKSLNRNYQGMKANGAAGIAGTGAFARFRRTAAGGVQKAGQAFDQYQSKNKMMEQAYDEKQQDAMLNRLTSDPEGYALAAAGGDPVKRDQMVARAALAQDERVMKDAKASVGGLSRDNRMKIANGENVKITDETGKVIKTVAATNANRRAALDGIGAMNAAESMKIATSVNTSTDQHVRAAAVGAVANSGAGVPWLTGQQLGNIENGNFDAASAVGASSAKLNANGLIKGGGHAVRQAKEAMDVLNQRTIDSAKAGHAAQAAGDTAGAKRHFDEAQSQKNEALAIKAAVRESYKGILSSPDIQAGLTQDLSGSLEKEFSLTRAEIMAEATPPSTPPPASPPSTPPTP